MISDNLKIFADMYGNGDTSKVIITDGALNIVYTNRTDLFDKLAQDMFSRSNIAADSDGLFPIETKTVLSLRVGEARYIAVVRPYEDDGRLFYIIEVLDSMDFSALEMQSPAYISELIRTADLRQAATLIYSAQLMISERELFENDNAMEMFDKSCYLILSSIANKTELQYYLQGQTEPKPVNISEVTEDTCSLCRAYLGRESIELRFDDIAQNIIVRCDRERYVAALLNLIVNSAKYNLSEQKLIEVSVRQSGNEVRVSVKDNGQGMSLRQIEQAYIPYALCSLGDSGGGLGLPVVNTFAKTFGGSLLITPNQNEGTTVTIRLPACEGSFEMQSPMQRYISDKFSAINVYLSQIRYSE